MTFAEDGHVILGAGDAETYWELVVDSDTPFLAVSSPTSTTCRLEYNFEKCEWSGK